MNSADTRAMDLGILGKPIIRRNIDNRPGKSKSLWLELLRLGLPLVFDGGKISSSGSW